MKAALAFDTSNYTTSIACFSPTVHAQARKLLEVPAGALGLRQQDALFQHVRQLPELTEELLGTRQLELCAVGASVAPREAEGSYMPCFLAGAGQGRVTAKALNVPFFLGAISRATWPPPLGAPDGPSCWIGPSWPGTCPAAPRSF